MYEVQGQQDTHSQGPDDLGRTALEAFTAIPFGSFPGRMTPRTNVVRRPSSTFPELVEFVAVFGPIGVKWGHEIEIDLMLPELRATWSSATEVGPISIENGGTTGSISDRAGRKRIASLPGPEPYLVARLDTLGPGRSGRASVERRHRFPESDISTRARFDNSVPTDLISELEAERSMLESAVDIADAIARLDWRAARIALEGIPGAVDQTYQLGTRDNPSLWAAASLHRRPFGGEWHPFGVRQGTDWISMARIWLALVVDQRLNFTRARTEVDAEGRFHVVHQATSLLEVIYRQLLSQVVQRPDFGFGRCASCGGRVIRTRKPGIRANRWHPGCKETGRKREQRDGARKEGRK